MATNVEILMAEGAYSCGGVMLHKNVELGKLINGELHLNDAGKALLNKVKDVTDVEVKPAKTRKPKSEAAQKPADMDDDISAIDDLLA